MKRCAVVTGANKGLGLEICRQLASNGVSVILTARDEKRGAEAVESLRASGLSDVVFQQLDVTNPSSIASLANFIRTHSNKLDILVNNAGVGGLTVDGDSFRAIGHRYVETYEKAEECLNINYYGTKAVTEALLPYLRLSISANIVNVSSIYGKLQYIPGEKVKLELNNVENLTEEWLDKLLQGFLKDFKEDKLQANGWPTTVSAYIVSKVAVNAYTRVLALNIPNMRINCVHPGYVKTDMNFHTGTLTVEEGAKGPVKLALLPDDGPSGHFFDQLNVWTF